MITELPAAAPSLRQPFLANDQSSSFDAPVAAELPAPMTGQNIVCFAKDWNEDPTSCNHVLRELAKTNKVIWVNSISTRSPNLGSGRDLAKIVRRLKNIFGGVKAVGDGMWLYTPFVLPFHHNKAASAMNRMMLKSGIAVLRKKLQMNGPFQLWTFVPTSAQYIGQMGEDFVVYYCTDEWSAFNSVNGQKVGAMVQSLASRADLVFATSRPLVQKLSQWNKQTHLASHGVNYELFAHAVEDDKKENLPADMAPLCSRGPVLGFYGLIEDWLDLELIAYLAERHPEWSIALVGKTCVDVGRIEKLPNVHFLGRKPHGDLWKYCKGFDVGLIPHKVNELTRNMNPIKLREYLSAGLPIVSTALPEMRNYPADCRVSESYAEFEANVEAALKANTPKARKERSASMKNETWESKVAQLGAKVMAAWSTKNR